MRVCALSETFSESPCFQVHYDSIARLEWLLQSRKWLFFRTDTTHFLDYVNIDMAPKRKSNQENLIRVL